MIVDLCCGSGALAAALTAALPGAGVHAADMDPAAVRCARRNLAAGGGQVYQGDLDGPLPAGLRGRVNMLLANVPYVPTSDIALLPVEAREHEARVALDGGPDRLDVLRRGRRGGPGLAGPRWPPAHRGQRPPGGRGHRGGRDGRAGPRLARSDELGATVLIGYGPLSRLTGFFFFSRPRRHPSWRRGLSSSRLGPGSCAPRCSCPPGMTLATARCRC